MLLSAETFTPIPMMTPIVWIVIYPASRDYGTATKPGTWEQPFAIDHQGADALPTDRIKSY